jgi:hypothetical protein
MIVKRCAPRALIRMSDKLQFVEAPVAGEARGESANSRASPGVELHDQPGPLYAFQVLQHPGEPGIKGESLCRYRGRFRN